MFVCWKGCHWLLSRVHDLGNFALERTFDAVPPLGLSPCAKTRHEEKTDEEHQKWLEEEEWSLYTGQELFIVSEFIGTKITWSLKKKEKKNPQILKQFYCLGF